MHFEENEQIDNDTTNDVNDGVPADDENTENGETYDDDNIHTEVIDEDEGPDFGFRTDRVSDTPTPIYREESPIQIRNLSIPSTLLPKGYIKKHKHILHTSTSTNSLPFH